MKTIVAGGRDFNDSELMREALNLFKISEIVCGDAAGADTLGSGYGDAYGITVIHFPADWKTHGKAAGHIRNKQMSDYSERLIAFWDERSKGTKNMIDQALKDGLEVHVYMY